MKSVAYAAIAALSAFTSAQSVTPAPTPGWNGWFYDGNGDGDAGPYGPFGGSSLDASQSSAFEAFTSANPSWAGPTDSAALAALTSALGITDFPSGFATKVGGGPGGFGGWGYGNGNGGWSHGGAHGGPFGAGSFGGWGPDNGSFCSTGDWTSGQWTSWWNNKACPASDWPGWTEGPWATNADWTTWVGCTATATATNVYTTIPANGTAITTITSFGYQVAQATNALVSTTANNEAGATQAAALGAIAAGAFAGVLAVL